MRIFFIFPLDPVLIHICKNCSKYFLCRSLSGILLKSLPNYLGLIVIGGPIIKLSRKGMQWPEFLFYPGPLLWSMFPSVILKLLFQGGCGATQAILTLSWTADKRIHCGPCIVLWVIKKPLRVYNSLDL